MVSSNKAGWPTLTPPSNFAMVEEGVYRSAYPTEANMPYLRHTGIRTVVLLSIEALPGPVRRSLAAEVTGKTTFSYATRGPIRVVEVADMGTWRVDGRNSGDDFSRRDVTRALDFAVDRQWHPVLFACPMGELQTSVFVGCMRRYQHWSLSSIFSECELFTKVCRNLRSSLLFLIESWDPSNFPISAVNIHYRNREMQLRDRSRVQEERRRHRRAAAAAALAKIEKSKFSDSAEETEEEDEEADGGTAAKAVEEVHSGTSDAVDKSALTENRFSSVASSPHKTFSETSSSHTPPTLDLKKSSHNPEAAFISTSGQRPPMMMRRAAAQRLRDQQQQQEQHQDPLGRSGDVDALLHLVSEGKEAGVVWAEWYLEAMQVREELRAHTLKPLSTVKAGSSSPTREALPPPHVIYADVRNPPALDSRSKFTKESIVEEDDD